MNAVILIGLAYLIFRDQIDPLIFGEDQNANQPSTNMPMLPGSPSQPATTPNTPSTSGTTNPPVIGTVPTVYPQYPAPINPPVNSPVRQFPLEEPEWQPGSNNCLLPAPGCPPMY